MALDIYLFILGMIIPAFITIFLPSALALWVLFKNPKKAAMDGLWISLMFMAIMSVLFLLSGYMPAIGEFIKGMCRFSYALFVAVITALSLVLIKLIRKETIKLDTNEFLYIVVAVVLAELILPSIGFKDLVMSVF